jgi:hypothetical protein
MQSTHFASFVIDAQEFGQLPKCFPEVVRASAVVNAGDAAAWAQLPLLDRVALKLARASSCVPAVGGTTPQVPEMPNAALIDAIVLAASTSAELRRAPLETRALLVHIWALALGTDSAVAAFRLSCSAPVPTWRFRLSRMFHLRRR